MTASPPVAILGFRLESNAKAPVCGEDEFIVLRGAELEDDVVGTNPRAPQEVPAFIAAMQAAGHATAPLSIAAGGAAGPVDQAFFQEWSDDALRRLTALGPVGGVYLPQHGAAIATGTEDPDGELIARVRAAVGPDVPIIVSLDPHANVGEAMVANCDAIIAYQTNPHVDQRARGTEAAGLMQQIMAGTRTRRHFVKLPMIPPSTAQVTATGPLGDHVAYGQSFVGGDVMAVCVSSGFSVGDTVKAGMAVAVTEKAGGTGGAAAARQIAQRIWDERQRYDITMTSIDEAVAMMLRVNADPALPSLCFADPADNPGGGGRGNTVHILKAFLAAGCRDVVLGPFFDAALAQEATALGVGATFKARFNRDETSAFSEQITVPARVEALHQGEIVARRGIMAGRRYDMREMALIACAGVRILVVGRRMQFSDPTMLECLGVTLDAPRGLVVKSRGHFRASVDEVFTDDRIIEVDAPGLTTPMLERIDFERTPRPIWPLDRDLDWTPQVQLLG